MTYPLSTTDLSGSLAQASPRTLPRETSPRRLQRRGSLRNAQPDIAKSAVPASGGLNLAVAIFCGKTLAAALIALFISFWLALDEPYWSLLTVFIVAQPDSGLVLAKGFYRLCGTAVGILVTTALVFVLAQYGELFIASLAAWIGVCAFTARAKRNFFSYGFQLAGYTAAIVGIPAALNTDAAYTLIVGRSTEITLGIGCMGLVSRLVLPLELAPKLTALARQLFHRVDHFAELAIDPADEAGAARLGKGSARQGLWSARDHALIGVFRERRSAPHGLAVTRRSACGRRPLRDCRSSGGASGSGSGGFSEFGQLDDKCQSSPARGSRNIICASARRGRVGLDPRPGSA